MAGLRLISPDRGGSATGCEPQTGIRIDRVPGCPGDPRLVGYRRAGDPRAVAVAATGPAGLVPRSGRRTRAVAVPRLPAYRRANGTVLRAVRTRPPGPRRDGRGRVGYGAAVGNPLRKSSIAVAGSVPALRRVRSPVDRHRVAHRNHRSTNGRHASTTSNEVPGKVGFALRHVLGVVSPSLLLPETLRTGISLGTDVEMG